VCCTSATNSPGGSEQTLLSKPATLPHELCPPGMGAPISPTGYGHITKECPWDRWLPAKVLVRWHSQALTSAMHGCGCRVQSDSRWVPCLDPFVVCFHYGTLDACVEGGPRAGRPCLKCGPDAGCVCRMWT